jgi:hypothetical protein
MEENVSSYEVDSVLKSKNYLLVKLPIEEDTLGVYKRSNIGAVDAILIDDFKNVSGGADSRREHYTSSVE